MIDNPIDMMEIQIDDDPPFTPERVLKAGNVFEELEITKDKDKVKRVNPVFKHAVIHYILGGLECRGVYSNGVWESGTNDLPRFHVRGLTFTPPESEK